jgi:glycosyltransferase involved in cell wall biosynthesis
MVSIVLVTYNRAKRLRLSIQDILKQTFEKFELIICDDCSPDETEAICKDFAANDKRVRYFRHASNLQMPGNVNFGISQAKHDYIAILHDGDRFHPNLIEQWYDAIRTHDVGFVFNSIGLTDQYERIVHRYEEFSGGVVTKEHLLRGTFFRRPLFDSPVYGEAMVRKDLITKYGMLKKEYGFYADVDLWMEILHTKNAYYCSETLITGPTKEIQPQLFQNDILKVFMYLYSMHLKHRRQEFSGNIFSMIAEIGRFYTYTLMNLCYTLLLVVKNFPFKYFINAPAKFRGNPLMLLVWLGFAVTYPVTKPALTLFQLAKKQSVLGKQEEERTDWKVLFGKSS